MTSEIKTRILELLATHKARCELQHESPGSGDVHTDDLEYAIALIEAEPPSKIPADFSARMSAELDDNTPHKGDFMAWRPYPSDLIREMMYHVAKLDNETNHPYIDPVPEKVREYAADVANYAFKAWQLTYL